jgi:hypothetical protein
MVPNNLLGFWNIHRPVFTTSKQRLGRGTPYFLYCRCMFNLNKTHIRTEMKIKQIRRTGPELFLVTYQTRWLKREVKRHAIVDHFTIEKEKHQLIVWRDNDSIAHWCRAHIEWMIRNDVDFFDNTKGVEPKWLTLARENVPNKPTRAPSPSGNEIFFKKDNGEPIPDEKPKVLTVEDVLKNLFPESYPNNHFNLDRDQMIIFGKDCAYHGRLERDNEVKNVINAARIVITQCSKFHESGRQLLAMRTLHEHLSTLPPLNPTKPTTDTEETGP